MSAHLHTWIYPKSAVTESPGASELRDLFRYFVGRQSRHTSEASAQPTVDLCVVIQALGALGNLGVLQSSQVLEAELHAARIQCRLQGEALSAAADAECVSYIRPTSR